MGKGGNKNKNKNNSSSPSPKKETKKEEEQQPEMSLNGEPQTENNNNNLSTTNDAASASSTNHTKSNEQQSSKTENQKQAEQDHDREEVEKLAKEKAEEAERQQAEKEKEVARQKAIEEEQEAARQKAEKEEAERQKAARQKAEEKQEAARQKAAKEKEEKEQQAAKEKEKEKEEAARHKAEKEEAERQKAARQKAARQKAERQKAAKEKEEQEQEAEREKAEKEEAARQKAAKEEAARQKAEEEQEAARQKAEKEEAERQKAAKEEAARQQAEEKQEAARQKAAKEKEEKEQQAAKEKEKEKEEAARHKAEKEEAERQKAARQKAERQKAAKEKEEQEQEAEREKAEKEEAARQKAEEKQEAARQKAEEKQEAARQQVDEEKEEEERQKKAESRSKNKNSHQGLSLFDDEKEHEMSPPSTSTKTDVYQSNPNSQPNSFGNMASALTSVVEAQQQQQEQQEKEKPLSDWLENLDIASDLKHLLNDKNVTDLQTLEKVAQLPNGLQNLVNENIVFESALEMFLEAESQKNQPPHASASSAPPVVSSNDVDDKFTTTPQQQQKPDNFSSRSPTSQQQQQQQQFPQQAGATPPTTPRSGSPTTNLGMSDSNVAGAVTAGNSGTVVNITKNVYNSPTTSDSGGSISELQLEEKLTKKLQQEQKEQKKKIRQQQEEKMRKELEQEEKEEKKEIQDEEEELKKKIHKKEEWHRKIVLLFVIIFVAVSISAVAAAYYSHQSETYYSTKIQDEGFSFLHLDDTASNNNNNNGGGLETLSDLSKKTFIDLDLRENVFWKLSDDELRNIFRERGITNIPEQQKILSIAQKERKKHEWMDKKKALSYPASDGHLVAILLKTANKNIKDDSINLIFSFLESVTKQFYSLKIEDLEAIGISELIERRRIVEAQKYLIKENLHKIDVSLCESDANVLFRDILDTRSSDTMVKLLDSSERKQQQKQEEQEQEQEENVEEDSSTATKTMTQQQIERYHPDLMMKQHFLLVDEFKAEQLSRQIEQTLKLRGEQVVGEKEEIDDDDDNAENADNSPTTDSTTTTTTTAKTAQSNLLSKLSNRIRKQLKVYYWQRKKKSAKKKSAEDSFFVKHMLLAENPEISAKLLQIIFSYLRCVPKDFFDLSKEDQEAMGVLNEEQNKMISEARKSLKKQKWSEVRISLSKSIVTRFFQNLLSDYSSSSSNQQEQQQQQQQGNTNTNNNNNYNNDNEADWFNSDLSPILLTDKDTEQIYQMKVQLKLVSPSSSRLTNLHQRLTRKANKLLDVFAWNKRKTVLYHPAEDGLLLRNLLTSIDPTIRHKEIDIIFSFLKSACTQFWDLTARDMSAMGVLDMLMIDKIMSAQEKLREEKWNLLNVTIPDGAAKLLLVENYDSSSSSSTTTTGENSETTTTTSQKKKKNKPQFDEKGKFIPERNHMIDAVRTKKLALQLLQIKTTHPATQELYGRIIRRFAYRSRKAKKFLWRRGLFDALFSNFDASASDISHDTLCDAAQEVAYFAFLETEEEKKIRKAAAFSFAFEEQQENDENENDENDPLSLEHTDDFLSKIDEIRKICPSVDRSFASIEQNIEINKGFFNNFWFRIKNSGALLKNVGYYALIFVLCIGALFLLVVGSISLSETYETEMAHIVVTHKYIPRRLGSKEYISLLFINIGIAFYKYLFDVEGKYFTATNLVFRIVISFVVSASLVIGARLVKDGKLSPAWQHELVGFAIVALNILLTFIFWFTPATFSLFAFFSVWISKFFYLLLFLAGAFVVFFVPFTAAHTWNLTGAVLYVSSACVDIGIVVYQYNFYENGYLSFLNLSFKIVLVLVCSVVIILAHEMYHVTKQIQSDPATNGVNAAAIVVQAILLPIYFFSLETYIYNNLLYSTLFLAFFLVVIFVLYKLKSKYS